MIRDGLRSHRLNGDAVSCSRPTTAANTPRMLSGTQTYHRPYRRPFRFLVDSALLAAKRIPTERFLRVPFLTCRSFMVY